MAEKKRVTKKIIRIGGVDDGTDTLDTVRAELKSIGIDLDDCCGLADRDDVRVKVVCVTPDLKDSVEEMSKSQRDQVVMVRVDEETSRSLDAWVESGAVRSRSEAAALFIREGLQVRSSELDRLREALDDVEAARQRLREKAREVFGDKPTSEE